MDLLRLRGDDDELSELRLSQANLVGPAGYISMEDGAATGSCSAVRARRRANFRWSRWAGRGSSEESRVSEASVRGLWQYYRSTCAVMTVEQQLSVENLLARYVHALDDDRLEEWPEFFAPTAAIASPPRRT